MNTHKEVVSLKVAIQSCLAAKQTANRRQRYLQSLRQYLAQFSRGREELPVSSFTVQHIEEWFGQRREAATTRASNMGRLSALFQHSWRRGWVMENPVDRLERITIEAKPPQILSVEQAERLLKYCADKKPCALAYLTLTLLAGVRPEEAAQLRWSSVGSDFSFVVVDAAASKVRQRRIVRLEPAARAWMQYAHERNASLPISRTTRRRYISCFCRALGFETWPQDLFRHTCASYWLAMREDAGYVAFQLGNSPKILMRHYKELVSRETASLFWSLLPDK